MNAAVTAELVGVRFFFDRQSRVVTPTMARVRRRVTASHGIRDVSFSIGSGEGVALLGPSGSGKTTVLRTIAGVLVPDEGRMRTQGRIGSLLTVDAGLMPTLTGRENSLLLAALAGLSRSDARRVLARIRERATLGIEFDHPVSTYSQGMRARVAFAVVEELAPDILLLDEVHEALDQEFRELLEERARIILREGGIVIAAGHDHILLGRLCNRAVLLQTGSVAADAEFETVRRQYVGVHSNA